MEKIFFEDLFETVANFSSLQLVLELEPSEKNRWGILMQLGRSAYKFRTLEWKLRKFQSLTQSFTIEQLSKAFFFGIWLPNYFQSSKNNGKNRNQ